ncbi:MAG: serine/threonine protein kinase [Polyangiaceae bacterium]|nr:serine/threonine protein kinase [Polyangiaceae bacterium]
MLGRYRLVAPLGQGGMARVHLACAGEGPDGRKLLVIKELRAELAFDPEFVTMFVDEGRLAVMLNHGNVVQTYETFSANGSHCLVMEYLDGQPLATVVERIGRQHVPLDVHLRVLADMLTGLHYAHELCDYDGSPLAIVHRDVSPQNVFLTYDGHVKVVDFGIAKGALCSSTTQAGEFKGKITYASPEQLLGEPVTRAADIFSAGIMLWEALTGLRAGAGETEASILHRRVISEEPAPSARRPDVPAPLDAICRRATARHPEDRFATAADFAQALEDYLATSSRRPGPRDLAALVGPPFEAERAALRQTIDAFFRALSQVNIAISTRWALAHPEPSAAVTEPTQPGTITTALAEPSGPSSGRAASSARWLLGGAALTLVALAPVAWRHPVGLAPAPTVVAPPAMAPRLESHVDVKVQALPEGALLSLDGAALGTTSVAGRQPRDGRIHRLDVTREGCDPQSLFVIFDHDINLSLTLKPSPSAPPLSPSRPGPDAVAPTRPREPPPPRPRSTAAERLPPKPTIDTSNPYG